MLSKEAQERAEWQKGNKKGEEKGYPPVRKEEIGKVKTLPKKIRKGVLTKNNFFCIIAVKKLRLM